jgi:hypothetical protein
MQDLVEYLKAYRAYVSANLAWGAVLRLATVWLAGMCPPLVLKALVSLPTWAAGLWMIVWALLGYVFGPYGMWKNQRAQGVNVALDDRR